MEHHVVKLYAKIGVNLFDIMTHAPINVIYD